jgi:molecular chaperone GrpE
MTCNVFEETHVSVEENNPENQQEESVAEGEVLQAVETESEDQAPVEEVQSEDGDWKSKAETLANELAALKDAAVRAQAEAQNVRRRAEQDVEKAHKFALEKFAKELLPVIDGLEKTIEAEQAAGNESTPLHEGVEMTLSMMLGAISKFGLEQVDAVGSTFDPALHEAMSLVEAPDAAANTVIAAMQKGYTLNGRLVRPAMVIVAK